MHCRNSLSQIFVYKVYTRHKSVILCGTKWSYYQCLDLCYVNFVFAKKNPLNYKTTAHCKIGIIKSNAAHTREIKLKLKNERYYNAKSKSETREVFFLNFIYRNDLHIRAWWLYWFGVLCDALAKFDFNDENANKYVVKNF